jgi:hypothetical protein
MRVNDGEISKRGKMYQGRVQKNKFIEARSRREKVNTRQSFPRFGRRQTSEEGGIVAMIERGGEEDQADEDIG